MGMFTSGTMEGSIDQIFQDPKAYIAECNALEVSQLPLAKIKEFCAPGGVGEQMVAEGTFKKKTLVRLNKQDDLTRRTKTAALQLARENNDPLWDKLAANRVKERELINKIMAKYGNKGQKAAIQSKKDFLSGAHLTKSFMQAGGEDRV